jgi:hypothetical protein
VKAAVDDKRGAHPRLPGSVYPGFSRGFSATYPTVCHVIKMAYDLRPIDARKRTGAQKMASDLRSATAKAATLRLETKVSDYGVTKQGKHDQSDRDVYKRSTCTNGLRDVNLRDIIRNKYSKNRLLYCTTRL